MVDEKIETSKERLSAVESNMARIDELEKLHQSLSDKISSNTKAISENQQGLKVNTTKHGFRLLSLERIA